MALCKTIKINQIKNSYFDGKKNSGTYMYLATPWTAPSGKSGKKQERSKKNSALRQRAGADM
jgi:hypothetical protein